jgi:hypothetical protein
LKAIVIIAMTVVLMSGSVHAQVDQRSRGGQGDQLVGVRIGLFSNSADKVPAYESDSITSSISDNAFLFEFFYNYFLLDWLALDGMIDIISRGDVEIRSGNDRMFGTASVYPLQAGIKILPFCSLLSETYRPYIHAGGSLVVAREIYDGGYNIYYDGYEIATRSETGFGWWIGGGFESYVSTSICITSDFKYQSIDYSDYIAGYKDHSGYQFSVGIAYLIRKK